MKKLFALLIMIAFFASCKKEEETNAIVKISVDYSFNYSASMYKSTNSHYSDFYNKYIVGKLLTPTSYNLNFRGLNNGLSFDFNGMWKKIQFFDLPTDSYVVTGSSYPKYEDSQEGSCSDTCFITFNDTIDITKTTTNIVLKANYDCYLILFDNTIKNVLIALGDSRFFSMKKTENLYHSFFLNLHPTYSWITITNIDNSTSTLNLLSYSWTKGTYYFNFINGEYALPEMNSGK